MIEMVKVRQILGESAFFDMELSVAEKLRNDFECRKVFSDLRSGDTVGIAVGSRGIDQIGTIVGVVAEVVRKHRAEPEVFAAMGSHGGTEEGQVNILRGLGIIPEELGVYVKASLECQVLDTVEGLPVYVNSLVPDYDWIVVVNRVKPHTSFSGEIESGLTKMLAVGLGGGQGARIVHSQGPQAISRMIETVGKALIKKLPIIAGIALVEDRRNRITTIQVCKKEEFLDVDRNLLVEARKHLPVLPFEELDVLIVNKMGKCFSGTGMDTNVIGRRGIRGVPDEGLKANYIVVLDLARESHGNANGIGLADITTERLVNKINYHATLKNVLTTSFLERAKIPVVFSSDREAIETALELASRSRKGLCRSRETNSDCGLRIVHIDNTLELEEFFVSPALAKHPGLEIVGPVQAMSFDAVGTLVGYI